MAQRSQAQGPLESGEVRERARKTEGVGRGGPPVCKYRKEWPRGHLAVVAAEEDQDKTGRRGGRGSEKPRAGEG